MYIINHICLSVFLMTFKSRSFGVHWDVYHRQCIIRQRSFQAEIPLVDVMAYLNFDVTTYLLM